MFWSRLVSVTLLVEMIPKKTSWSGIMVGDDVVQRISSVPVIPLVPVLPTMTEEDQVKNPSFTKCLCFVIRC